MSKRGRNYNWDGVHFSRNQFQKNKALNPRREFPQPFNEEDRFLIEENNRFFILTILSVHKMDKYKTYQYDMSVEEFEEEYEEEFSGITNVMHNINYLWKINTSPPIIERISKGFITHSVLLEYKNNIIPIEEYAKIVLTKKEVVSDRFE